MLNSKGEFFADLDCVCLIRMKDVGGGGGDIYAGRHVRDSF